MIDIENDVFNAIAAKVKEKSPNASVYGELILAPSSFPCVTIEEADNYVYRSGVDSTKIENFASLMYEVNVYSNKQGGKKKEAKALMQAIDEEFHNMGFTRTMTNPVSMENSTIYRITCRFSCVASKDKLIFGG